MTTNEGPELPHLDEVIDWRAIVKELVEAHDAMAISHDAMYGSGRFDGDPRQKLAEAKETDQRMSEAWETARAALGAS